MLRKLLRVFASIVFFVFAAGVAGALTVKGLQSYVWRTSHLEQRFRFQRDLARGERIGLDDLSADWLPVDTPTTIPTWRAECVADRAVLADVASGDLVQPLLVDGALECLRRERPDDWSRD